MKLCPTCGRRPSERVYIDTSFCPDPIHRTADAGPQLLEALEWMMPLICEMDPTSPDDPDGTEVAAIYKNALDAIVAAKGEGEAS